MGADGLSVICGDVLVKKFPFGNFFIYVLFYLVDEVTFFDSSVCSTDFKDTLCI